VCVCVCVCVCMCVLLSGLRLEDLVQVPYASARGEQAYALLTKHQQEMRSRRIFVRNRKTSHYRNKQTDMT